jgi:hypothetical protein
MRYTKPGTCEYCGEPFPPGRREDARFCPGSACRVANHRREQRREEAAAAMANEWPAETLAAYESLTTQYPQAAPTLLDLFNDEGQAAAAAAVKLAYELTKDCEAVWTERLMDARQEALSYEAECEVLEEVRRLVK